MRGRSRAVTRPGVKEVDVSLQSWSTREGGTRRSPLRNETEPGHNYSEIHDPNRRSTTYVGFRTG